jgi:zinc protease
LPVRKPRTEPEQVGLRRLDFKAPAEQAYVALSFKVPGLAENALDARTQQLDAASQDALALAVLSAVLDGYDGARLQRALTLPKNPLAANVGSYYGLAGRGPKTFTLYGVPSTGKKAQQLEIALREQIALIAQKGIDAKELERVKIQWVASEVFKLDSVFNQARELGVNWINGFPVDGDTQLIARLRQVTAAQVQSVAARYFGDDALTIATLLPQPLSAPRQARSPAPVGRH